MATDPERTREALALFKRCLPLPADSRGKLLEEACGADTELRAEIEAMLRMESEHDSLDDLDIPDTRQLIEAIGREARETSPYIPKQIGPYRIIRFLGEGGMGLVYEAEQSTPRRRVALKILRPEAVSGERQRRFEREVEVLGRLSHPGIAQVFEGGTLDLEHGPQPFLSLELVDGIDILEFCQRRSLEIVERFELLVSVADAVQHAHERGVVHRDLKPDNILVDASGQPKILDFGVAHVSTADGPQKTALTTLGELVGTMAYMSPEQVSGNPDAVTSASDVYSLGVLAYQLLGGRLPVVTDGLALTEAVHRVKVSEPALLGTIDTRLHGDPEAIVAKAMEKEIGRRYRSAGELADDVRRWLRHEPVQARRPTLLYQLRKLARRHRGFVTAVGAILLGLVAALALVIAAHNRATQAADFANRQLYRTAVTAANYALNLHDVGSARTHLESVGDAERGWEWHHVHRQLEPWLFDFPLDARPIGSPAYLPDTDLVALALDDQSVVLCEPDLGRPVRVLHAGAELTTLSRTQPPGQIVAGTADGRVMVWDLSTGEPTSWPTGLEYPVTEIDVSTDGTIAVIVRPRAFLKRPGSGFQQLTGYNAGTWEPSLHFSPDGTRMVALAYNPEERSGRNALVVLYDVATGERSASLEWPGGPLSVAFDPTGQQLAVGCRQRDVLLLDGSSLEIEADLLGHVGAVDSVAYASGGRLVSSSEDGTMRIWNTEDHRVLDVLRTGWAGTCIAVDARSRFVTVIAKQELRARAWTLRALGATVLRGHSSFVYSVDFSPGGDLLASAAFRHLDRSIGLWDPVAGLPVGFMHAVSSDSWALFSLDGKSLVFRPAESGPARAHELETGRELTHPPSAEEPGRILEAPPPGWLAHLRGLVGPLGRLSIAATALSLDDEIVVRRLDDNTISVTQGIGGPEVQRLEGAELFGDPDLSPDGAHVISPSLDHDVYLWEWRAGRQPRRLHAHSDAVYSARFSPDGRRLATGGNDNRIVIWDTDSWEPVLELLGHERYAFHLAWSPDGTQLASASGDGTVRVWDSLPVAVRHRQMLGARELRDSVRGQVETLWAQLRDPEAVAASLDADPTLSDGERAAAARVLLELRLQR